MNTFSYLALGDSYTIGEQVPQEDNFPFQTAALLRKNHFLHIDDPKIIATTGWTTDELSEGIKKENIGNTTYDFVTLLIGVNNQYRERDIENYKKEFAQLLIKAILFANGRTGRVFVLSIPDWGVTPFAEGRDRSEIARQINQFNITNRAIALSYKCHYLDITGSTREHGQDESYLTPDKLHYAAKEYKVWAEALCPVIAEALKH
jgi:lysophospholipase L1-like esterase